MKNENKYVDMHKRMIRYVFLNTEIYLNDDIRELSEYDIQSMIFTFFRFRQDKFNIDEVTRESSGKTDIVLKLSDGNKIYIEIKTYFKEKENFKEDDFNHDFRKLAKKAVNEKSLTFFILSGTKDKLKKAKPDTFEFISGKMENSRRDQLYSIELDGKIEKIKIRPSRGQSHGRSILWSWRIIP